VLSVLSYLLKGMTGKIAIKKKANKSFEDVVKVHILRIMPKNEDLKLNKLRAD